MSLGVISHNEVVREREREGESQVSREERKLGIVRVGVDVIKTHCMNFTKNQ